MAVTNAGMVSKTGFLFDVLIALQTIIEDYESRERLIYQGDEMYASGKTVRLAINRKTKEIVISPNKNSIDYYCVGFAGMISNSEIHELQYWDGSSVHLVAVRSEFMIEKLRTDLVEGRLIPYYEETALKDWEDAFLSGGNRRHLDNPTQMSSWFVDTVLPALVSANAPISLAEDIAYILCKSHLSKLVPLTTEFGHRIASAYSKGGVEQDYKWFVERIELHEIGRYSNEDVSWLVSYLIESANSEETTWKLVDELISLVERRSLNLVNKNRLFSMAIDVIENSAPLWHTLVPKQLQRLFKIKPHYDGDVMRTLSMCKLFVASSLCKHKYGTRRAEELIEAVKTLMDMEKSIPGAAHRLLLIADRAINAERGLK